MTRSDLKAIYWAKLALGHEYVQLTVVRSRPPRGERVRLMPGVMGRVIGELDDGRTGRWLVDVKLADLARLFDARSEASP